MTNTETTKQEDQTQEELANAKPEWQTPSLSTLELNTATASGCLFCFETCGGFMAS